MLPHFGVALSLSPGDQPYIEVLQSVIEPHGSGGKQLYALNCEIEFVHVVQGELEVQLGPEIILLSKGDSLTFKGSEPHTWRNPSATEGSQVIWVMAPASI